MDNTFENGFMCGLLMSIDDKSYTKIKDPVFRDILENGAPVATINLSAHYKNVLTWYKFTKFPCAYATSMTMNTTGIDETIYYIDTGGSHYYTDTHYEAYFNSWGPMILFSVIYKGEEPLFASTLFNSGTGARPTLRTAYIMHEDYSATDHSVGPHPYEKELVCYKIRDIKFLTDDIEYMGNYRLAAQVKSHETTGGSDTYMSINAFISEKDDTTYSSLKLQCPYEEYTYSDPGSRLRERPTITLESTATNNLSFTLYPNSSYAIYRSGGTYSDFTIDELSDVQFNIYYDISCELGKGVINPPKKAILLN